jgi:carbonic anhydrase
MKENGLNEGVVFIAYCSDPRIQKTVTELINFLGGEETGFFPCTAAGGPADFEHLKKQASFASKKLKISKAVIMSHEDCLNGGSQSILLSAKNIICEYFYEIRSYHIRLNGTWEEISLPISSNQG